MCVEDMHALSNTQQLLSAVQAVAAARAAAKFRSRLGQPAITEGGLRKQISLPKDAVVAGVPDAQHEQRAAPQSAGVGR